MKVLIVEDDAVVQQVLKKMVAKAGLEVLLCDSGEKALEMIVREKVRMVISDWILPGMDGVELCRRVRKLRMLRYVYMVVLTSRTKKEDLLKALDAGADDYIPKPFDDQELAARLRVGQRILTLESRLISNGRRLMKMAKEDPLTGVLNRRALFDEALKELNRASREKAPVATVLVEADNVRNVSESYGHMGGDVALVELGNRIRDCCRQYDKLGRYGDSQFMVVLPRTSREGAVKVAERIRRAVNGNPVKYGENRIRLSASIGIYAFSFGKEMAGAKIGEGLLDEIIDRTDYALDTARKEGGNRVAVYAKA
jgi:two-component system, cell cycle response regulator